jgi:hypothetical protein
MYVTMRSTCVIIDTFSEPPREAQLLPCWVAGCKPLVDQGEWSTLRWLDKTLRPPRLQQGLRRVQPLGPDDWLLFT